MNPMKFRFLLPILLLLACNPDDSVDHNSIFSDATCNDSYTIVTSDLANHIQATTDFAFDMFRKSTELKSGNRIQSPVSIYSALLMLYEGADCDTKAQIAQALNLGDAVSTFPSPNGSYADYLDWMDDDSDSYSLTIANALFSDPNRISLLENYKDKINTSYKAELSELDFSSPSALETINQWAANQTEGKIEKVLDEIGGNDVAFLMNALYFKSDWKIGFEVERTKEKDFTKKDGAVINVPFMNRDEISFFHKGETLDLVQLPLKNNKYVVNIFVPADENVSIDEIIQQENLKEIFISSVESCEAQRLIINLPKFELKGQEDIKTVLIELGMKDIFSKSDANLTPMGSGMDGNLFVNKALHDTYIKLDEKGIEGAAITTVGVNVTSLPPSINFDRPFAFVVRKVDSYAPLFIGKVENPL